MEMEAAQIAETMTDLKRLLVDVDCIGRDAEHRAGQSAAQG